MYSPYCLLGYTFLETNMFHFLDSTVKALTALNFYRMLRGTCPQACFITPVVANHTPRTHFSRAAVTNAEQTLFNSSKTTHLLPGSYLLLPVTAMGRDPALTSGYLPQLGNFQDLDILLLPQGMLLMLPCQATFPFLKRNPQNRVMMMSSSSSFSSIILKVLAMERLFLSCPFEKAVPPPSAFPFST